MSDRTPVGTAEDSISGSRGGETNSSTGHGGGSGCRGGRCVLVPSLSRSFLVLLPFLFVCCLRVCFPSPCRQLVLCFDVRSTVNFRVASKRTFETNVSTHDHNENNTTQQQGQTRGDKETRHKHGWALRLSESGLTKSVGFKSVWLGTIRVSLSNIMLQVRTRVFVNRLLLLLLLCVYACESIDMSKGGLSYLDWKGS